MYSYTCSRAYYLRFSQEKERDSGRQSDLITPQRQEVQTENNLDSEKSRNINEERNLDSEFDSRNQVQNEREEEPEVQPEELEQNTIEAGSRSNRREPQMSGGSEPQSYSEILRGIADELGDKPSSKILRDMADEKEHRSAPKNSGMRNRRRA